MSTPTLRALRQHFGDSLQLTGILRPHLAEVLSGNPWLDEMIFWHPKSAVREQRTLPVIRRLRERHFDRLLLLTNSLRTGVVAWLSGAPDRIGYARYGRGRLLTTKLSPPREGRHWQPIPAVDYYLDLVGAMGVDAPSRHTELWTTLTAEAQVTQLWAQFQWNQQRVVVLNTGGAYGAAKAWPDAHFAALARMLVEQLNCRVLVICGPAERENSRRIASLASHRHVVSLADQPLSIELSKAVIRRSQLLISTDSGPRHFGAAFGVPTVALFGPTDPRWSANYHTREIALAQPVPCGPCAQRVCPLHHHRCMQELTAERVFSAAAALLSRSVMPQAA